MSTPDSTATEWDPLGPNSPLAEALLILRPKNAAAKLAFSNVVDFLQEQDYNADNTARSHYAKYIWYSDELTTDPAVTHLVHSNAYASSSSPSSSSKERMPSPVPIWTGFYFIDPRVKPLLPSRGWAVGRLSSKSLTLEKPVVDLLLTTSRRNRVARRHACLTFAQETRMACVKVEPRAAATVNNYTISPSHGGNTAVCAKAENSIAFEDLGYTLEYTNYCRTAEGRSYTITGANLIGMGTYGRVKPATGPEGNVVVIKNMVPTRDNLEFVRSKVNMVQSLSRMLEREHQKNVLTCIAVMHMEGKVDEFHLVLEPFVENTLMVLPKQSQAHWTKLEIILRDCLQGLSFLHAHNFVHTDIKPPNIGLKNLTRSLVSETASCPPPARRLTAVILDIDSIIPIPANGTTIPAQPGTNGTIGFHSPEQERTEFDGTADIWALGICMYRAVFGELPWRFGALGNPWINIRDGRGIEKISFHEKYSVAVRKVGEKRCDEMGKSFLLRHIS
ncbi:kinase-like domain-containing protein [Fusarium oxysporum f. sp. albedinis]|nr:kinase-like domain-containing protein [Fusarium oxysporum f. sp. albedinis]